jgi:tRNA modification GTPase
MSAPHAAADTIAAVATPAGRGGIGVVRVSGPVALEIGRRLTGRTLAARRAVHCVFRDPDGEPLDDGLAIAFPGPASFTGEDVLELQGHGGPVVLDGVLRATIACGARPARPGEFSERAFLNDRLDLAQAEAIADLVDSASAAAVRGALRSLQGAFSERIGALMEAVTDLRVYVEASMDFPDEEVDFLADGDVAGRIAGLRERLEAVRRETGRGVLLTEGMTLVLAGAPNAGKSSLMNALARRDTAIVTEIPGTTRDVLRETVDLDGLPVHLVDTAGLRETDDVIEAEGVRRARGEIARADALLLIVDAAAHESAPADRAALAERLGAEPPPHCVVVRNKIDRLGEAPSVRRPDPAIVHVALSALTGEGLEALVAELKGAVGYAGEAQTTFTARARHLVALDAVAAALDEAAATLAATGAGDLVAEDLRRAHDALGEIVGAVTPDDLLGRIFSSFCIGK